MVYKNLGHEIIIIDDELSNEQGFWSFFGWGDRFRVSTTWIRWDALCYFINDQVSFKNVRYSLYRVWCLKELRGHFQEASKDSQSILKDLLQRNGSWMPLWEQEDLPIDKHFESNLPFKADSKMIGVYEK